MGWQFDGVNDYVTVADNAGLTLPDGNWTIAVWLKPDTTGSTLRVLFAWGVASASPSHRILLSDSGYVLPSALRFDVEDSDSDAAGDQAGSLLTDDTWHFLLFKRVSGTFSVRLDNVEVLSATNANVDAINVADSLYLGFANGGSTYFHGTMAEFAIWSDSNTSRDAALSGGASYDDYTTNRTQYISMRDGYTEEETGATVTNNGTVEDASDHPAVETYIDGQLLSATGVLAPSSINVKNTITAPLLSATGVLAPASINQGFNITAPLLTASGLLAPASIVYDQFITAPLLSATGVLAPSSIPYDQFVTAPVLSATGILAPSSINVKQTITAPVLTATGLLPASSIAYAQAITAPLVSATGVLSPLSIDGGQKFFLSAGNSTSAFSISTPAATTDFTETN